MGEDFIQKAFTFRGVGAGLADRAIVSTRKRWKWTICRNQARRMKRWRVKHKSLHPYSTEIQWDVHTQWRSEGKKKETTWRARARGSGKKGRKQGKNWKEVRKFYFGVADLKKKT